MEKLRSEIVKWAMLAVLGGCVGWFSSSIVTLQDNQSMDKIAKDYMESAEPIGKDADAITAFVEKTSQIVPKSVQRHAIIRQHDFRVRDKPLSRAAVAEWHRRAAMARLEATEDATLVPVTDSDIPGISKLKHDFNDFLACDIKFWRCFDSWLDQRAGSDAAAEEKAFLEFEYACEDYAKELGANNLRMLSIGKAEYAAKSKQNTDLTAKALVDLAASRTKSIYALIGLVGSVTLLLAFLVFLAWPYLPKKRESPILLSDGH